MRASELRIGNLVQDENGNIYIAETISEPGLAEESSYKAVNGGSYVYSFDKLQPIPLTEEWQRRFDISIFEFRKCAGGFMLFIRIGDMELESFIVNKIEYVHELQNWHSVIFGTELTIK